MEWVLDFESEEMGFCPGKITVITLKQVIPVLRTSIFSSKWLPHGKYLPACCCWILSAMGILASLYVLLHRLRLESPAHSFTVWKCHCATSQDFLCSWHFSKVMNTPLGPLLWCVLPVIIDHACLLLAIKAIDSLISELLSYGAPHWTWMFYLVL